MLLGLLVIVVLQKIAVSTTIPCKGYLCGDGTCVNGTHCDGVAQCADGSDELRCKRQLSCHSTSPFNQQLQRCRNGNQCGISCNKIRDCDDGSDEEECCYTCVGYDAILGEHGRICPRACNGITECDDGSDERECPPRNIELPVTVVVLGSVIGGLLFVIGCPAAIFFIIVYSICKSSK